MKPLMPQTQTHQIVKLTTQQALSLATLVRKHENEIAHISQATRGHKTLAVEFIFPNGYYILPDGEIHEY